jgi:hypothetical protein
MLKSVLLPFVVLLSTVCTAQDQFSFDLKWDDPLTVDYQGEQRVIFSYQLGADAGAIISGELPDLVHTFRANSLASRRVEIVSLRSEPLVAPALFSAEPATAFGFTYRVSRQTEGNLGKISGPAIIQTPSGLERLIAAEVRLVAASPTPTGSGRSTFARNSVLRQGETYRFEVEGPGMYRLDRGFLVDQLRVAGLEGVDPRDIKIYGQGPGMLPETTNAMPPDDLIEQAIRVSGESDGSFDNGDYILLYAHGPDEMTYSASSDRFRLQKHIYSTTNSYYLQIGTPGRGRRVSALPAASGGTPTESYDAVVHLEDDRQNVLHELDGNSHGSGPFWFGDFFQINRDKNYPAAASFPDAVADEPLRVTATMALRSPVRSQYLVEVNGQEISSSVGASVRLGAQELSPAVRLTDLSGSVPLDRSRVDVRLVYPTPAGTDQSEAWLDFIQLWARRQLTFAGQAQFSFRDTRTVDAPTVRFQLGDATGGDVRVWRINGADIREAALSEGSFSAPAGGELYEYVAFRDNGGLPTPTAVGRIEAQNLHATERADMIIVTHPDFLAQAERLAEHRRSHNGYTVSLVTTRQIYNEFSGGKDDAAAIRNYVRMVRERDPNLRYLLLFGDGSFDHRNLYGLGTAFIPTYQYQDQFTEVESFPSDDFFGIVLPAVGSQPLGPDLTVAVGRLPVKSADEASGVVEKLIRYDTSPSALGDWRTRMVFVGDDEDGGVHTRDVNRVAASVATAKPDLNFDKLYFDLFPQISLSSGDRYPAIKEGLDRAVFRGALAVTYLGHGGPRGWGQERVLTIPQIRNWSKPAQSPDPIQPPLFMTATCTFSNYDDASFVSAGEEALLTPRGGVIALMTTTRPVFARQNYNLTNNTVQAMLERPNGEWRSLGDIIRIGKNATSGADGAGRLDGRTENVRKFTLLGDPATVIAFPRHAVRTTAVDSLPVSGDRQDTVRALQQMRVSGEIIDVAGNVLENFNGEVYPTIYDKAQTVPTLQQDSDSPLIEVEVQRNIIFRGRATVTNGRFSFEFVVPNDINYSFGPAKVSYYAADRTQFTDAAGFYDRLIVGGTGENTGANDLGPEVEVYLDNTDFVPGAEVSEDPVLLLHLSDDLGINVTGNSIGHDLEAVLDGDTRNPIVLNDYYEADVDNFRSGKVRYPLFDLEPGVHSISVRAWDVANNSTVATTEFIVSTSGGDAVTRLLNYPNPFTQRTCFQFDHTLVGQEVEAIVQIYTVNGRLVKTIERGFPFSDGAVRQDDCIAWDGLDDYGDELARGVYLYQVRLRGDGVNVVNSELQKLVIF